MIFCLDGRLGKYINNEIFPYIKKNHTAKCFSAAKKIILFICSMQKKQAAYSDILQLQLQYYWKISHPEKCICELFSAWEILMTRWFVCYSKLFITTKIIYLATNSLKDKIEAWSKKIFNVTHKIPNKHSMSGSNGIKLMNNNYIYREFVIFCIKNLVIDFL